MVHVVDAGHEDPEHQFASVNKVLQDVVPEERPTLMVFNKMDLVDRELFANLYRRSYPGAIFVSAHDEGGPAEVRDAILARLLGQEMIRTVTVPVTNLHCLSRFHRTGSVLEQTFAGDQCRATLRLNQEELSRLLSREGATLVEDPAS
jgi:GTP-binding protein HflX